MLTDDIAAVSLDAAGTLIRVAEPVGQTYARLAARHGITVEPAAVGRGFRIAYTIMPPLAFPGLSDEALVAAERDWWRQLVRHAFGVAASAAGFDAFFEEVFAYYAHAGAWRAYPEVQALLEALEERHLPVVVTSNFDTRLHGVLEGLGLRGQLAAVLCSSTCGAAKPEARIFTQAARAAGVAPARLLHAGDDPRADYEGARAAGLHALLVHRHASAPLPPGAAATLLGVLDLV